LYQNEVYGPYLVVGPLSTIANWAKEFARWAPTLPVVLYHGKKPERERMRRNKMLSAVHQWKEKCGNPYADPSVLSLHYFFGEESARKMRGEAFPVVITSYEVVMMDRKYLQHLRWKYIVVDEGHRLKNLECRLIRELKQYDSANRLLLTGTPLQNNLSEVSLLNEILILFNNHLFFVVVVTPQLPFTRYL
jgi:ATP-dependent DNA helicase